METSQSNAVERETTDGVGRDALLKALEESGARGTDSVTAEGRSPAPEPVGKAAISEPLNSGASRPADSAEDASAATKKELSPYEQAQQRTGSEWEKLNAEKARLEADRKALEAERAKVQAAPPKGESPEDYEAIAKEFASEGRDDLAQAARERAAKLRAESEQAKVRGAAAEFRREQTEIIRAECAQEPDLLKPETELFQAVERLIKRMPVLLKYPQGFRDAVSAARDHVKAQRTDALAQEVAELKEKLGSAEQKLQPGGGEPPALTRSVTFDTLPLADQRRLLQEALRDDGSGA